MIGGDRNTRSFHARASVRKRFNGITRLQHDHGNWTEDQADLCNVVQGYFEQLVRVDQSDHLSELSYIRREVSTAQNSNLLVPFTFDEFAAAIHQMHPDKSPGQMVLIRLFISIFGILLVLTTIGSIGFCCVSAQCNIPSTLMVQ